jgi:NAD(P)-dependent dehydrogenase (short-subunit alcohol dehydrogenase family)
MVNRRFLAAAGLAAAAAFALELWRQRPGESLEGQVALITGGSRGLGFLIARELAREGCRVAVCARDEAGLARARVRLEAEGAEVLTVACDIADRAQVENLVRQVNDRFGRVDIVINNAGIIQVGPAPTMTLDDFQSALNVIFWGPVYLTLAALPGMIDRRHGRLVNVTSIGGKVALPQSLPYTCAKFALVGFSEGLRAELGRYGIKVTTVVPWFTRTGSHVNAIFKEPAARLYPLFALAASLPGLAMSPHAAARQIVLAIRRGEAEVILGVWGNLLARAHGLAPGLMAEIFGLFNRLLPGEPTAGTGAKRGYEIEAGADSALLRLARKFGQAAAEQLLEYPARFA